MTRSLSPEMAQSLSPELCTLCGKAAIHHRYFCSPKCEYLVYLMHCPQSQGVKELIQLIKKGEVLVSQKNVKVLRKYGHPGPYKIWTEKLVNETIRRIQISQKQQIAELRSMEVNPFSSGNKGKYGEGSK